MLYLRRKSLELNMRIVRRQFLIATVLFVISAVLLYNWVLKKVNLESSHYALPYQSIRRLTHGLSQHGELNPHKSTNGNGLTLRDNSFYLDEKPFRIISGSFHYFRTLPEQWSDRLMRMKSAGLNTVTTYIPWNLHERYRGVYEFGGRWDLVKFIQMVDDTGLYLIIRAGPYICAEWEFGGLPSWLLHDPNMKVRTSRYDPYLKHVRNYFTALFPLLEKFTFQNGGPILAFQIENEFGSYGHDVDYLSYLVKLHQSFNLTELLFTSDGDHHLVNGSVPGVFMTVNFKENPVRSLHALQTLQPNKPLMVTEFWPGWFDHWGESHHTMQAHDLRDKLETIFSMNASINLYMFVGGTNFGLWNGANGNIGNNRNYQPTITSYDYDALVAENGDCHPTKYKAFRNVLLKYNLVSNLPPIPPNPAKKAYGVVEMTEEMTLTTLQLLAPYGVLTFPDPIFMEFLGTNDNGGQGYGWILYKTEFDDASSLHITGPITDRAHVFVNGRLVLTIYADKQEKVDKVIDLSDLKNTNLLEILVENMGRVNYNALNNQRRGFQGQVTNDGKTLRNWQHISLEFCNSFIESVKKSSEWKTRTNRTHYIPTLYRGQFSVDHPEDTFIDMRAWKKGIVILNDFILGRYWSIGPQQTLYVPKPLLNNGINEVMIFELEQPSTQLDFIDHAILSDSR